MTGDDWLWGYNPRTDEWGFIPRDHVDIPELDGEVDA